jgi:hypothetical protein
MIRVATVLLLGLASPAAAAEIFEAEGAWVGEGLLSTGAEAPLERGRCRVEIAPEPDGRDVSVTGSCAVAVGISDISLRIVRSGSGRVNAGFWSAATGQTVQFSGTETDAMIEMGSTTALTVGETPYESRVSVSAPDESSFTIRQLLRAEGAEAWRLVVDMTYRKASG